MLTTGDLKVEKVLFAGMIGASQHVPLLLNEIVVQAVLSTCLSVSVTLDPSKAKFVPFSTNRTEVCLMKWLQTCFNTPIEKPLS